MNLRNNITARKSRLKKKKQTQNFDENLVSLNNLIEDIK